MTPLHADVADSQIIALLDQWAGLLEREDYEAAHSLTDGHARGPTAGQIREAVQRHGRRVTSAEVADGRPQEKEVTRWPTKPDGACGDVWYDLNVDGRRSDLTALFHLRPGDGGLTIELIDISVR